MVKGEEGRLKKGGEEEEEAKAHIWDCDSCLYDSFELTSLKRQIDSAIVSRSMSMPHLSEQRREAMAMGASSRKSSSSKITRSFQKLLKVFRKKPSAAETVVGENGLYVIHSGSEVGGVLPLIPESGEGGVDSAGITPDFDLMVWRSASERFKGDGVAVSCR